MKFTCVSKNLSEAVQGVSRAVSASSAVPVLQGLLLRAEGFKLELTGYDLEIAITTAVEANVTEPGEIVMPAKLLGDMLRNLSSEEVSIETDENLAIHIKGGVTEYDLVGMNAADFPELPAPGADLAFEIDAAELAAMIGQTLYAVSTDDKKPAHTGELFSIVPGELTIVALDGFRLAITHHPVITERELNVVVPAKTCAEVARLMGDCGEAIRVDANKRYIVFAGGQYVVISRLIEGDFLNYRNVVPEGFQTRVAVEVPVLEKAIESCSVIITERLKNPLRVTFSGEGGISISCQTPLGRSNGQVAAEVEGEEVEIGFNFRYLLDALRNSGCDRVILEVSGALSPVKMLPAEGDDFMFLVLPVRFKND